LSYNPLTEVTFPPFLLLQQLDLSGTRFVISPRLNAPKLVEFYMDQSTIEMVDFTQWVLPGLQSSDFGGFRSPRKALTITVLMIHYRCSENWF
ncbi:hypothetical protein ANCDUO_26035, partial [Ancylostoma duodenale]